MKRQRISVSQLPDDVLGRSIISKLSLKDAVRTSLVSSTWRPLFTFRPHLCFDLQAFFTLPPHKPRNTSHLPTKRQLSCEINHCYCLPYSLKFVEAVNQFLDSYKNSPTSSISSFKIKFCLDASFGRYIDLWVAFALKRSVKKLVLDLSCLESFPERHTMDERFECLDYTLGSGLLLHLQHLNLGSQVEDLEMRSCNLDENIVSQLLGRSLRSVRLSKVPLGREEVLESICCCCPNLRSLVLEKCRLPLVARVTNDTLETLSISDCIGFEEIEILGTNLVAFEYRGVTLVKLSFVRVPKLRKVCLISKQGIDLYPKLNELGIGAPAMKDLAIYAEYASLETSMIPTFRHVEELKLCLTWTRHFDMTRVIKILEAFPLLQKLHLAIWCRDDVEQGEENIAPSSVHRHLKEVEISGFRCTENNIEFVMNLLKFAEPCLKSLSIKPKMQVSKKAYHWKVHENDSWEEGEREAVVEELQDHLNSRDKRIIIGL